MKRKECSLKKIICRALTLLWEDIKAAKWVIILIIAYFAFMKKFLYSLCPMVLITGFPCPGCGLTRAAFCLFHFDFLNAFFIHPFIYPIVIYLVIFGWNRYLLGRKMGRGLLWGMIGIMAAMLLFYILRMFVCFPGDPPMSYYKYNLFAYIQKVIQIVWFV